MKIKLDVLSLIISKNKNTRIMPQINDDQIKEGLDKAYKEAGHNAYFANGFEAGIKFARSMRCECKECDPVSVDICTQCDGYVE